MEAEAAQLKASVASADSRLALREAARNRAARNLERTLDQMERIGTRLLDRARLERGMTAEAV